MVRNPLSVLFEVTQRSHGKCQDGTGLVLVHVNFTAIVFKPFVGEVWPGFLQRC